MINIAQSPFLQALGLAIANSLWQAALLWLFCFVCQSIAKPKAHKKYVLVASAALLSLLWFVYNVGFFYWKITSLSSSAIQPATGLQEVASTSIFAKGFHYAQTLIPYLSCAYMLVTALLAVRLFNGFKEVKTLRHAPLHKAPVAWRVYVKNYAAILQISKPVEVWLSAKVNSPLIIGFWKPIILLPLAGINHLSTQQVEAILLHELSHIRRYDYLVNILLQIAEILLFFNPFVRLLLKQAYQERENSCDDWVLQFNYNGADYARALLSIQQTAHAHMLALGANNHGSFYLLNRIKRIINPEKKSTDYRTQLSTLAFVMLTLLLVNTFVPAVTAKQHAPKVMAMTNADFFASPTQMKSSLADEIETAAKAFSKTRFTGTKLIAANNIQHHTESSNTEKEAVINMMTAEEAVEIAVAESNPALLFRQANESFLTAPMFEIEALNKEASINNAQLLENSLYENRLSVIQQEVELILDKVEKENKVKLANMEEAQQKLQRYQSEIQELLSVFAKENWLTTTDNQLKLAKLQKEKLLAAATERYAAAMAEMQAQKYSFSYEVNAPAAIEQRFGTGNPLLETRATKPSKNLEKLTINSRAIVRSKDNKHITINLAGNEKELSICLPADTQEETLKTMKQLETMGVLIIEHKAPAKPAFPKKPRVIVSL